jgi:hypothetical protein
MAFAVLNPRRQNFSFQTVLNTDKFSIIQEAELSYKIYFAGDICVKNASYGKPDAEKSL